MTKILIEVRGGAVVAVHSSDPNAAVVVVDHDNEETGVMAAKAWREGDDGKMHSVPPAIQPR